MESFHGTGENPWSGDADAIAAGGETHGALRRSCHRSDGTGRIGPDLPDDEWTYERTDTDVGRFEIVCGGRASSMQAFGQRIDRDEILKLMAFRPVPDGGVTETGQRLRLASAPVQADGGAKRPALDPSGPLPASAQAGYRRHRPTAPPVRPLPEGRIRIAMQSAEKTPQGSAAPARARADGEGRRTATPMTRARAAEAP